MREIYFRGKREDNGKWVEGYYMKHINRTISPMGDEIRPEKDIEHIILFDSFSDWNMPRGISYVHIDPKTLGQYTGFCDEYGKKIYEGDIIHYLDGQYPDKEENWNCLGAVIWDDEAACFYVVGVRSALTFEILSDCVVVGNIHDNPKVWKKLEE